MLHTWVCSQGPCPSVVAQCLWFIKTAHLQPNLPGSEWSGWESRVRVQLDQQLSPFFRILVNEAGSGRDKSTTNCQVCPLLPGCISRPYPLSLEPGSDGSFMIALSDLPADAFALLWNPMPPCLQLLSSSAFPIRWVVVSVYVKYPLSTFKSARMLFILVCDVPLQTAESWGGVQTYSRRSECWLLWGSSDWRHVIDCR